MKMDGKKKRYYGRIMRRGLMEESLCPGGAGEGCRAERERERETHSQIEPD